MTQSYSSPFSAIVIGNESLLVQCSEMLMQNGHDIRAIVSDKKDIIEWAQSKKLHVVAPGAGLADRLQGVSFDWLFSIANLSVIPKSVLSLASSGAVNFHDGPLPNYAGLNAPVWALLNQEKRHGITWHMIEGGVDEGDIIEQRMFDISTDDTALTLNTKCFEAAIDSFPTLLNALESGSPTRIPQDLSLRHYFGRNDRPKSAAQLDFSHPAVELVALVRGLNHGKYLNPLYFPKILVNGRVLLVGEASMTIPDPVPEGAAGTVLSVSVSEVVIATGSNPIALRHLYDHVGNPISANEAMNCGDVLAPLNTEQAEALTQQLSSIVGAEPYWRDKMRNLIPAELHKSNNTQSEASYAQCDIDLPKSLAGDPLIAAVAAWVARINGNVIFDLALSDTATTRDFDPCYCSDWVPVRFDATGQTQDWGDFQSTSARFIDVLAQARINRNFARDLGVRDPEINAALLPGVGISVGDEFQPIIGVGLTVELSSDVTRLHYDTALYSQSEISRLAEQLEMFAGALAKGKFDDLPINQVPILSDTERDQVLYGWNNTEANYDRSACIHQMFEAQVLRTPDAEAIVFEDRSLSYTALNEQANRVANVLRDMGVGPETLVGLYTHRSLEMLIGALAIQKAGGAYVPMDTTYPKDRIAHFIKDSAASIIITQSDLLDMLPEHMASVLVLDTDARISTAPKTNIDSGVTPQNLAYLIYTSGSTGLPKGVMVQHSNVANFFAGMDNRISSDPPGVWLAVTSLSFDISVLELFYTLARGFKVVLGSDDSRIKPSDGQTVISDQKMAFSLYNWGNDDFVGNNKYELLLEGAKFADKNGFCAVWTPERHFHAFGGLYPNPSVTGAAIAAVTENLAVRAGSIVAPLHHPIRIAEEWAVIDNLTNGRVGLAIASGWQPNDFVLRPENTPPENKPAMFEAIKIIRKLWAGETVEFPTKSGKPFGVVTQPRPLSKKMPIWVTTAGNPETWKEAGTAGANVLTHLLGQSIDEVKQKTVLYHDALRAAGYDPDDFTVTLMLHTYVGSDRETVRETAREPMKSYLRSAAGLIKQYAWAFPAFKKPKGVNNAFDLNLESLSKDELESILDFAFERYFEDAGLFGTVDDCLKRIEELKQIGVGEVACLVDYGLSVEKVLEGLVPLAEVLKRANTETKVADDDFSIAAQITRHKVTHLQCTPSMARMLCADDHARQALGKVKHLMIGGEPFQGSLLTELGQITTAHIENMYGPTETTIWSSTEHAKTTEGLVSIGRPIANTQFYVLDAAREPVPIGVPGELYIGGDGVARGYWQRPDLTKERFLPNPYIAQSQMYRTGDLVVWREDGRIDFLSRVDNQVKLRGHRIELGEIEANLETNAKIKQAVVVTHEFTTGDIRLVAYLITNTPVLDSELRGLLGNNLPDYMIPSHFITLAEMPLTPNKKVDRNNLPAPTSTMTPDNVTAFAPLESSVEQQIAVIWSRILGVAKINPSDSFFDLGGHSLLAVQAHREIKAEMGVDQLSITDIFRFPVLSALASQVETKSGVTTEPESKPVNALEPQTRDNTISRRKAMRARRMVGA